MDWILANWQGILGGGSLTTIITYFANRKNAKADILTKAEGIYESLFEHVKMSNDEIKLANTELKEVNKAYFARIETLSDKMDDMQNSFNQIQLAYAKEVEISQNWEKLHQELLKKYNDLQKQHNTLQKDHTELKRFCQELEKSLKKTH